jgi:hypothetical protein
MRGAIPIMSDLNNQIYALMKSDKAKKPEKSPISREASAGLFCFIVVPTGIEPVSKV